MHIFVSFSGRLMFGVLIASVWLIGHLVIDENDKGYSMSSRVPILKLSSPFLKRYKMVVGILTAKREPPTVIRMAKELVAHVNMKDYKMLVRISTSASRDEGLSKQLADLGFIIYVDKQSYPELAPDKVRITFNDPLQRVLWRTSHVLDYANLLENTLQYQSEYVLILEDDLKPARFALDKCYNFAKQYINTVYYQNWGYITFYSSACKQTKVSLAISGTTGACTLMIRRSIIPSLIRYLRRHHYDAPVDLLLFRFIESKHMSVYESLPNLFQHISPNSSYTGADQAKRKTERARSVTFLYDEDNHTLSSIPIKTDGYIGCFKDHVEDRDLSGLYAYHIDVHRLQRRYQSPCAYFCRMYRYYGLQNGRECFCGNEFGRYGWAPDSECNMPCRRDSSKTCGGLFRNSVYRNWRSCLV